MIRSPFKVEMNLRGLFLYVFEYGKVLDVKGGEIVGSFATQFVGRL
jgi:hypothetical protein